MSLADLNPEGFLTRPALAVELTDRMRRMIMEGELKGGEKVPEKALTERFGVSRTPVREALKVLAHEGFVQLVPNRGAVVARQTLSELAELFPLIAVLEGLAGELAAERASDEDIAAIGELTRRLRESHEMQDRPTYFEINQAIHAAILTAAGNPTLIQHHAMVARRVYRARYQANLTPERWLAATREHEVIHAALARRDAPLLGRLMKEHLQFKLQTLVAIIDE
ncbi:GntR family transcriptional regulator [Aurantimonas sp. C2-6-R+9]|uniref:GntR family transcriptional regulator n=1 Tax=unclassified Aurantimonas TaxID=2638230 RepID=UPI002E1708FE|nr:MULTISPECIES: GntR family transcriptional regulator [unclassified Aurantimonas]MEC5290531.1 GntR family transcriptional regulator [Aurantimonas sp. C2-3-R2]MEC5324071.1 GntR family transcriptional regulator [Aurantimonas sp. A3-2-R12]MEC5380460.1 GntR family transcriptional regulator [Aurantimonas sp. C2-6-R+9]MEC5411506.1 GntR family transcriptional regulator [Aurantimonas sp. C2-4-R8]